MKINKINDSKCYTITLNEREMDDLNLALLCAQNHSDIFVLRTIMRFKEYSKLINGSK